MRIWIVYILALLPLLSIGQTLELSVSKNPVAVGEEFRIDFTLNGEGESFNPPNLNDYSSEEDSDDDEIEARPLTHEELKLKTMKVIHRRAANNVGKPMRGKGRRK